MIAAIRKNMEKRDEGFTLIELLVVVIIIGILAAIAIPTFLNQRERGWQAELTAAVRNAALEVETNATQNNGTYPAQAAGQALMVPFTKNNDAVVMALTYSAPSATAGYKICGTHTKITAGSGAHNITYKGPFGTTTTGGLAGFVSAIC